MQEESETREKRALLIEDEAEVAAAIAAALAMDGFDIDHEETGEAGLKAAAATAYDVLVVDRNLPGLDGLSVLKRLREMGIMTPTLILSALGETKQKIEGLEGGADDYLGKPYDPDELRARVAVLCRRALPHPEVILIEDLEIWTVAKRARRAGQDLKLTPKEFTLLEYLARNEGIVVTRTMILKQVFGLSFDPGTNVVDVHIARLRKTLDRDFERKLLKTDRGNGYLLA